MKNKLALATFLVLMGSSLFAQVNETEGVSIANDGVPPSRDAVLDIVSSTKGMLIPRVEYSVISSSGKLSPTNVASVADQDGLLVFVTTSGGNYGYWYFNVQDNVWKKLASGEDASTFWSISPSQTVDADTGIPSNHIYNTGFEYGNVAIGLNQAIAQLHVFGRHVPLFSMTDPISCFIAETNSHSFGVYDRYTGVGSGHLLIHRKKSQSSLSTAWLQMDHANIINTALVTGYTVSGAKTYGALEFKGLGSDGTATSNFVTSEGVLVLRSDKGEGSKVTLYDGFVVIEDMVITSDSLLKTNIQEISGALDKIQRITGYRYNWVTDGSAADKHFGVMAQNIEREFPELSEDVRVPQLDTAGVVTYLSHKAVNYNGLVAVLIQGINEQQDIIDSLETRINTLETDYINIDARITALETR